MTSGGVGRVSTERVVLFGGGRPAHPRIRRPPSPVEVAYETYGTLDADRSNVIIVLPRADGRRARRRSPRRSEPPWLVGQHHRPWSADRHGSVLCGLPAPPRRLPGHDSPTDLRPQDWPCVRAPVPAPSLYRDLEDGCTARLFDALDIERVHTAIGGSLGGMQALQWALDHPSQIERAVLICATARLSAQNIALFRRRPVSDHAATRGLPKVATWTSASKRPDVGLANGTDDGSHHVSLRRVDAAGVRSDTADTRRPMTLGPDFEVEHYLNHQGESFLGRFDALTYLYLSRTMDYFDPFSAVTDLTSVVEGRHTVPCHLVRHRLALQHRTFGRPRARTRQRRRRRRARRHRVAVGA